MVKNILQTIAHLLLSAVSFLPYMQLILEQIFSDSQNSLNY